MAISWSKEVDPILSVGIPLEHIGVRNWALNDKQAFVALDQFFESKTVVLGGDVYLINHSGVIESSYDNWYCERKVGESYSDYIERSIFAAKNYISNYKSTNDDVLFCLVPQAGQIPS